MWISKQTIRDEKAPQLESATVTLNANGEIEASSGGMERSVEMYAPFGYSFSALPGSRLLISRGSAEQACLGTRMKCDGISAGEIKITSPFGGYIYLKADGSVVINGLSVNKDGVIE